MGKYKAARPKGKGGKGKRSAIPCIAFLILLMALLALLFYGFLKGGALGHAG
jgi:hypothetical protein